jgi:hypothetical protein
VCQISPHSKNQLVKNRYTTILIEHHKAESVQPRGFLLKTTAVKTSEAHRRQSVSFKNGKETSIMLQSTLQPSCDFASENSEKISPSRDFPSFVGVSAKKAHAPP